MKFKSIIYPIFLFISINLKAQKLYSDQNVIMSYKIYKTNVKCSCVNKTDNYFGKIVNVWKVEVKLKNLTSKTLRAKLNTIGYITIKNSNKFVHTTMDCNNTGFYHNSWPKNNLNNSHWVSLSSGGSDVEIAPNEIKIGYSYFDFMDGVKPVFGGFKFGGYSVIKKNVKNKDEDEFWSGKKNETVVREKQENQEYWSGDKKNKSTKEALDGFWSGRGTKEEEEKFEEKTKPVSSDQFIGNVRSRTSKIRIQCKDTGAEDGDLVRISNNDVILKDKVYLTNAGRSYWFDLKIGQNKIEIKALNQGALGANTAAFKVFDENGNLLAQKGWHLKTGFKGKLLILKI